MGCARSHLALHAQPYQDTQKFLDYVVQERLRLWLPLCPLFKGTGAGSFKIHDAIVFCSSVGVYIIMQLGVPDSYMTLFADYLYTLETLTLKFYNKRDLPGMRMKFAECMTRFEKQLPTYLSTIVRHFVSHFFLSLRQNGTLLRYIIFIRGCRTIIRDCRELIRALAGLTRDSQHILHAQPRRPPATLSLSHCRVGPSSVHGTLASERTNKDLKAMLHSTKSIEVLATQRTIFLMINT
jgi:hypothetical protein